jgi:hypothetical protein
MFVFEKVLNEKEPALPESVKSQLVVNTSPYYANMSYQLSDYPMELRHI